MSFFILNFLLLNRTTLWLVAEITTFIVFKYLGAMTRFSVKIHNVNKLENDLSWLERQDQTKSKTETQIVE